ncbi:MAG: hypothetical protein VKJ02_07670 [Snowella sp.]|nr:hypothetical protein [Snowella sp.]
MIKLNLRSQTKKPTQWWVLFWVIALSWGLLSCSDRLVAASPPTLVPISEPVITGKLAEVPPPESIQALRRSLDSYQPQVKILSPQPEQVLEETSIAVKLAVQDLPIFQNADLAMGPHLHLILDNEPYQAIYDVNQPFILKGLTPGTHTLRIFASRPWHESFKNDGAYAQTTFHVLTKTEDNRPDPALPLLTYSRPKGDYGAEPILLDFYLTNAPLHVVAQESPDDAIADWRIRVTINGESFILDNWQPIYLKGFENGKNWVKLEFIDEQGNTVANTFNNTVRVINYQPNGQDSLSKLVRGEIPLSVAKSIVNPAITVDKIPEEAIASPNELKEPETLETPTQSSSNETTEAEEAGIPSLPVPNALKSLPNPIDPLTEQPKVPDSIPLPIETPDALIDNALTPDSVPLNLVPPSTEEPISSTLPLPTLDAEEESIPPVEDFPLVAAPLGSPIPLGTEEEVESIAP